MELVEPLIIVLALVAGVIFKQFGYPPLLGYILAGFVASASALGDDNSLDVIYAVSDAGITLLLFTIGLKINLRELMSPKIWAVGSLQIAIALPAFSGIIWLFIFLSPALDSLSPVALWSIAFALSFSSTVFAVKIFDERGESGSYHTRITIGILVLQDIFAVIYLAASTGMVPHWWAAFLLLIPFLRKYIILLLEKCGHTELLNLCGIMLAFGAAELFYLCNVKGDLGALIMGIVIAGGGKGDELYKNLIHFKDLFLVAFFVSVGYAGLPTMTMFLLSAILAIVILMRPLLYFGLFTLFHMRARTSLLASLGLFSYSEFGLIVATIAVSNAWLTQEWVTMVALALAISFFIAVPFNAKVHELYFKFGHRLKKYEKRQDHYIAELNHAKILVLGMGRVGGGAYHFLHEQFGEQVVGIEAQRSVAEELKHRGLNVVKGDATDYEFWENVDLNQVELIVVSLSNHRENLDVVQLLQKLEFPNKLAVIARFSDELKQLKSMGCIAFNLYAEAGHGFAEHVLKELEPQPH